MRNTSDMNLQKVKGKNANNGQWVFGWLYYKDGPDTVVAVTSKNVTSYDDLVYDKDKTLVVVDESTLCEFTGKQDSYNNDVYVNDVFNDGTSVVKQYENVYVIQTVCGTFPLVRTNLEYLKVTGNIIDDPEKIFRPRVPQVYR